MVAQHVVGGDGGNKWPEEEEKGGRSSRQAASHLLPPPDASSRPSTRAGHEPICVGHPFFDLLASEAFDRFRFLLSPPVGQLETPRDMISRPSGIGPQISMHCSS